MISPFVLATAAYGSINEGQPGGQGVGERRIGGRGGYQGGGRGGGCGGYQGGGRGGGHGRYLGI